MQIKLANQSRAWTVDMSWPQTCAFVDRSSVRGRHTCWPWTDSLRRAPAGCTTLSASISPLPLHTATLCPELVLSAAEHILITPDGPSMLRAHLCATGGRGDKSVAGVRCARKRAGKHTAHSFLPGDSRYDNRTLLQTFELSSHFKREKKDIPSSLCVTLFRFALAFL